MSKLQEIYSRVTESIISKLEHAGSWSKLWDVPTPISLNGHQYRGVNFLLLATDQFKLPVYGTYNQIRQNGGQVKKGEKSTEIVFWSSITEMDPVTKHTEIRWFLKIYFVFNVEQADFDEIGQRKIATLSSLNHNTEIQSAEQILELMPNAPQIIHDKSNQPRYMRLTDRIFMPDKQFFTTSEEYYHVLFHELIHSTGHSKRLDRFKSYKDFDEKDMHRRSREELVAELGASFLSYISGINYDTDNSIAYINGWSKALRENPSWIVWSANRAQEAVNFILQKKIKEVEV